MPLTTHVIPEIETVTVVTSLLSNEATVYLLYIIYPGLCQILDVFGVGANILNILCFVSQGFKDPVNISLLGLAVSDIGCLLPFIWTNICCTPAFMAADLPFDPVGVQYLTTGLLHTVFTRITGCITAFITFERCLCITAPLKVSIIITPRRVSYITVTIFVIMISSAVPEYVVSRLDVTFFPDRNKTLIGIVFMENRDMVARASHLTNNVFIPLTSFITTIVCTVILVTKLRQNTEWRQKSTTAAQSEVVLHRNQRVSKVVVMVAVLFVICFIPLSLVFIGICVEPDFFIDGKYRNLAVVLAGIGVVFESINSSMNIFIYYYMSERYRKTFHELLLKCNRSTQVLNFNNVARKFDKFDHVQSLKGA